MELAYAAADAVICRAGALTVSELCIVALPAILVPSPNVAEDHQTKNAMALVHEQAAILVKDGEAVEKAISSALGLLKDEIKMKELSTHIASLKKENAAVEIAQEIIALAE